MDRPLTGSALHVAIRRNLGAFTLDVDFEAADAGVTVLFGPSGAGKSQTLAAVAGAMRPQAGRVSLGDRVLFDAAAGIDVPMRHRAIGWVFQDARLFPHLDVAANLRFGLRRARGRREVARFADVVGVLGIAALLKRRPRDLSGGERQRVAVGRALLSQPHLLLLDEPLSGLDAPRRAEILPYLEGLKARFQLPMLYVTHDVAELARLADRVVVLEAGRVAAEGPVNAVMGRPDLPLLGGREDARAAFDAEVQTPPSPSGLSALAAGSTILLAPGVAATPGRRVRVSVRARDVLLALEPPRGISARNILPGRVRALARVDAGVVQVSVRLDGGPDLLAAVTVDAVQAMALAPTLRVWAVIKAVAVEDGESNVVNAR